MKLISVDVRGFLEKLFVEKDQRPTADDMRHDHWVFAANVLMHNRTTSPASQDWQGLHYAL